MSSLRYRFIGLLLMIFALALQPAVAQGGIQLLSFEVSYGGRVYDAATNQTTFSYVAQGVNQSPDLSHFDIEIPSCTPPLFIVNTSPTDAVSFGVDPTTGIDGIKWDLPLKTTDSRTYTLTFQGNVAEGSVLVAVKADSFETGTLPGPSCQTASIDVDKFISTDGITWMSAADAPGPEVELGAPVSFRFVITNIGNVDLTDITLSDNVFDTSGCTLPATLKAGAFAECIVGPFTSQEGPHTNIATATGLFEGERIVSTDSANYFSGNFPLLEIDKLVSKNGGTTWHDDTEVKPGREVSFKFVISNPGNVPLTNLTLADSAYDTASCTLPETLEADSSFECIIGPFTTGETDHTNTVTLTAQFEETVLTATDTASYRVSAEADDETDIIIVIEGPVEAIIENVIVIFGFEIEIDPNDPILTRIQIGDLLRIEGDMVSNGSTVVIIAIVVIIVDIDIVITGPPSAPIYVPAGCKITGIGNNNPRLKCSNKGSRKSSKRS